jgi:hypothetical protein
LSLRFGVAIPQLSQGAETDHAGILHPIKGAPQKISEQAYSAAEWDAGLAIAVACLGASEPDFH